LGGKKKKGEKKSRTKKKGSSSGPDGLSPWKRGERYGQKVILNYLVKRVAVKKRNCSATAGRGEKLLRGKRGRRGAAEKIKKKNGGFTLPSQKKKNVFTARYGEKRFSLGERAFGKGKGGHGEKEKWSDEGGQKWGKGTCLQAACG